MIECVFVEIAPGEYKCTNCEQKVMRTKTLPIHRLCRSPEAIAARPPRKPCNRCAQQAALRRRLAEKRKDD